jgi:polar amino acid transport system ATP-binding protein
VLDNISLAPRIVRKVAKDEAEDKARALLKRVGLLVKERAYPEQLFRRSAAACCNCKSTCNESHGYAIDEPTSALDPEMTKEVLSM